MTNLVYLVGYICEMGYNAEQCRAVLLGHGYELSLPEVRRNKALFEATFPALTRVNLCRCTLTLSERFREVVSQRADRSHELFSQQSVQQIGRMFEKQTYHLRTLDHSQKTILIDEMAGALFLRGDARARHIASVDAHLTRWLMVEQPHIDPDYYYFILSEYLGEIVGVSTTLDRFKARLCSHLSLPEVEAERRVLKQILPAILDFFRWLITYNPVDHRILKDSPNVFF